MPGPCLLCITAVLSSAKKVGEVKIRHHRESLRVFPSVYSLEAQNPCNCASFCFLGQKLNGDIKHEAKQETRVPMTSISVVIFGVRVSYKWDTVNSIFQPKTKLESGT